MAATGALLGVQCYPSQAEALDAYYAGQSVSQLAGSTSYINEFVKEYGVWKIKAYSVDSSGVWTARYSTNAPGITFPACDPTQSFQDGMVIGWGISTALVVVSAITFMKRATRAG